MGAATRQLDPFNGSAALQAWLTGAAIDRCLPSVIAVDTLQVTEVRKRGAANANADLQHVHQAFAHLLQLSAVESSSLRLR